MSRVPRHTGLVVAGIVIVSAAVRFVAARSFHVPWVAPDEMAYGLLGQSLWQTGELTIRGTPIGYYSLLYPALAGGPLSLGDTARDILALQAVQAVVMSAAAVPVFVWGRRMMGERWALVAAVLTVLPPALAYSGMIMSEALYYPVVVAALLAVARAVQEPTLLRLGVMLSAVTIAATVRLQALVLLPTFVTAAALDAFLRRDGHTLRRYARGAAALLAAAAIALALAVATGRAPSWGALLGAYETVGDSSPGPVAVLEQLGWSAGGMFLLCFGLPLLATAVLAVQAVAAGETDPRARAYLTTTVAYVVWLIVQVALFAARYVDYVAERYLITAVPLLFLGLCLWIARGAERPIGVVASVIAAASALVATIPPVKLFVAVGAHDLLTTLPFRGWADGAGTAALRAALLAAAAAVMAAFALVPRRWAPALAALVAVGLGGLSIASARQIASMSGLEQANTFGAASPDWIDRAAPGGRTVLLNTGDRPWPALPRTAFWNSDVTTIARLLQAQGSGAIPQRVVEPRADGVLRSPDGRTLSESFVAAPTGAVVRGEKVAETPPTPVAAGLALWRVTPPARLESLAEGLGANGDFAGKVRVTVFACSRGRLELTLLGKSGGPIAISANGIPLETVAPPPQGLWQGGVPAPPDADGTSLCVFELHPRGLAGSTRIAFVRE